METDKYLRQQLGFTQQQMADYLGLSRGYISSVETGKREFSSKVMLRQTKLSDGMIISAFLNVVPGKEVLKNRENRKKSETIENLELYINKCRYRLKGLANQLKKCEEKSKKADENLEIINACMCSSKPAHEIHRSLMVYKKALAEQKIIENGTVKQLLLKTKLELLKNEISMYEKLVGEIG